MTEWRTFDTEADADAYERACWHRIAPGGVIVGHNYLGEPVLDGGFTLRWAIPLVTADGRWAVPCPEFDDGDPEPAWPDPKF